MGFLLLRVVSIFLITFVFSLIIFTVYKKWIRPTLLKEKLDGELIDAKEAFKKKQAKEEAQKISKGDADGST